MFLLLLGATISGLLIPSITQRWQNHQKELDVKSRLVGETSAALATFRGAVQRIELGGGQRGLHDLDAAYANWGVKSAVIRSELEAYFPHKKKLLAAWDDLDTGVTGAYYVLKNPSAATRHSTYSAYRSSIGPPKTVMSANDPLFAESLEHIPAATLGAYDAAINFDLFFPLLDRQRRINTMILSATSAL
jgi:hypothetical protein